MVFPQRKPYRNFLYGWNAGHDIRRLEKLYKTEKTACIADDAGTEKRNAIRLTHQRKMRLSHAASEGRLCMQIGFIGAGRVGVSLGRYFKEKGRQVGGYYSRSPESAAWAAAFTETTHYKSLEEIISGCDMIFFTVPDDAIASVWKEAKPLIHGKIIAHCSGLCSSNIFSDAAGTDSTAYSIHPLCAVSDRENSWQKLNDTLFTVESGDHKSQLAQSKILDLFAETGNRTCVISAGDKAKYHAAASLASNHVTAVFSMAKELLMECGFEERTAERELYALARGNLDNILSQGCTQSLTGPVERGDAATIKKHLEVLKGNCRSAYLANARQLAKIAREKYADRDDTEIRRLLSEESEKTDQWRGL